MKQQETALPLRAAKWVLAAATILLAALLIFQCAGIYAAGTSAENLTETGVRIQNIYSPEIVAGRFSDILWAVVLWLAAFVAVLVFKAIWPEPQVAPLPLSPEDRLDLLKRHAALTPDAQAEERRRKTGTIVCASVCLLCAVPVIVYVANPAHFASRDLESVVGTMLLHIVPWIVAGFAVLMIFAWWRQRSQQKEIALLKGAEKHAPQTETAERRTSLRIARIALYAAALALLIIGTVNGGMRDVLVKAINICTECIGLG